MAEQQKLRATRYAHLDGFTDLCYSDDGKHMITCGQDGDVRIFQGVDDDECTTHTLADSVYAVAYMDGSILIGTDQNMVQSVSFDEGKPNGIVSRFTDAPTHITICKERNIVAMGSSDMTIKVNAVKEFKETHLVGHGAPILSVAIDSQGEFLGSSSCDGSVRIWDLISKKEVHRMDVLEKCNDFAFAESVCRLSWTVDGKYLVVPIKSELCAFSRNTWSPAFTLKSNSITEDISVTCVSPCGRFIACGGRSGTLAVFNIIQRKYVASAKSTEGMSITAIKWNPVGKAEIAYCNSGGQLGTYTTFLENQAMTSEAETTNEPTVEATEDHFPPLEVDDLVPADDGDDEFSISKIKKQMGFADDEDGTFLGLPDDPKPEETSAPSVAKEPSTVKQEASLPEPQRPFQPGMSPEQLSDRYMVWNNIGIVRQYSNDKENSIEVEFHDVSVHHALHLNNHYNHSMASLNEKILALAAEAQDDQASKLVVQNLASWGGNKEWQTDMPEGEDIVALAVGRNWVGAATDAGNLRIFSASGVQKDVLCIPGPVVCLAGHSDMISVVFHSGIGTGGDQQMSTLVFNLTGTGHLMPVPTLVPLSPGSYLAWSGFSDEGSPIIVDSTGIVKQFHFKFGPTWSPILNTQNLTKGKSDHYFVIGASEAEGKIRAILCKGSRYPAVLPRPHVSLLDINIPMCEADSEKSTIEQSAMKLNIVTRTLEKLERGGFDVEIAKRETEKTTKEVMIKMFALACRSDRESRAFEICEMMPSYHAVQLAIKYAGKLHKVRLAERLGEIAERKMEEELRKKAEEEERYMESLFEGPAVGHRNHIEPIEDPIQEVIAPIQEPKKADEVVELSDNPLLEAANRKANKNTPCTPPLTPTTRNPFKKSSSGLSSVKGFDALDSFKSTKRKSEDITILRPVLKKPKISKKSQPKVQTEKENQIQNTNNADIQETPKSAKKVSALQLWIDDNKDSIQEQFPDIPDSGVFGKAALIFKDVDETTKQKYKQLAQTQNSSPEPTETETTETPKSAVNKLKAFAFSGKKTDKL